MPLVYEEVVSFLASGLAPDALAEFKPSPAARERVEHLLRLAKNDAISPAERSELDHYLQIEHLMRLVKARANAAR